MHFEGILTFDPVVLHTSCLNNYGVGCCWMKTSDQNMILCKIKENKDSTSNQNNKKFLPSLSRGLSKNMVHAFFKWKFDLHEMHEIFYKEVLFVVNGN